MVENKKHPYFANNDGDQSRFFQQGFPFPVSRKKTVEEDPSSAIRWSFPDGQAHALFRAKPFGRDLSTRNRKGKARTKGCSLSPDTLQRWLAVLSGIFPDGPFHFLQVGVPDDGRWAAEKMSREGYYHY